MTQNDSIAKAIYQALLDGTGDAVSLNDFSRYLPFYHKPHFIETFEGRILIEAPEDLHAVFQYLQDGLRTLKIAKMMRTCTVAQFSDPDTIRGYHETRLLDQGMAVCDVYSGLCTLRLIDGHWRIAGSQFVGEKVSLPTLTLRRFNGGIPSATAAQ